MKLKCKKCGNGEDFFIIEKFSGVAELRIDSEGELTDYNADAYDDADYRLKSIYYYCCDCRSKVEKIPEDKRYWNRGKRMKKLKVKFTYECEIEVKPEELEILKKNLNDQENIDGLVEEINEIFLTGDGRTEAGTVTNYTFEVEEWK